jgi:ribonuclease P/MRP protein subunit POP5
MTLITCLPKPVRIPCVIQVVRVSGTMKKAEEEAIRRARETLRRAMNDGVHGLERVMAISGDVESDEEMGED